MIVEAGKVLQSGVCTQKESVFQCESGGRRNPMSQFKGGQEGRILVFLERDGLFVLFRPTTDGMKPTCVIE